MKRLVVAVLLAVSCTDTGGDARELEVANVISRADESLIRGRPALAAGKYVRMAGDPVAFVRGTLPLYRHDVRDGTSYAGASRFALEHPLVPSLGDPHPENFGTLRAADGSLALEPNDFDAADRAPYLWDIRRLAAGMALAAARSNEGDASGRATVAAEKRAIARRVAAGYVRALDGILAGAPRLRVSEPGDNPILVDLFRRSKRDLDARAELTAMTTLEGGTRRLKRGVVDPEDPQSVLAELPGAARDAISGALARYRTTLLTPPNGEYFTVLDVARKFGSGVASWPRVRVLALVRGPSDAPEDDVLLELKELADAGVAGVVAPGVYHDDLARKVIAASRQAWARPDAAPLWSATEWLGLPVQLREETEAHKTIRVARMVGERGTVAAIGALAETLGTILARVHASASLDDARAIRERIGGDGSAFADEQADFASTYADQQLGDASRFGRALRRLGLRLAVPVDPADLPNADFAAVLGTPPPPPELR